MIAAPDPAIVAALALTTGLALSSRRSRRWPRSGAGLVGRYWLPWLMLAVIAVTSTAVVVTHPRQFAAAASHAALLSGGPAVAPGPM